MPVAIGEIIHKLVKDRGLKARAVADYVNISESTLFGIYKRESVDIDKLISFSRLLNKNLFVYYLNEEPLKSMFSKEMINLQNRIIELENELKIKTEKIIDLSDIVESQKKVISFHEMKSESINHKKRGK